MAALTSSSDGASDFDSVARLMSEPHKSDIRARRRARDAAETEAREAGLKEDPPAASVCPACDGYGRVGRQWCPQCDGTGMKEST